MLIAVSPMFGAAPRYQQEAFCRMTLTDAEGKGTFDIFPIEFPGGRKPATLPRSGDITVRFLEIPTEEYLISWSAIANVETFNELVFQELRERQPGILRLVASLPQATPGYVIDPNDPLKKTLEELYGYYDYLSKSYDPPPGLAEPYRQFLLGEAIYYGRHRDWVNAIARLERLYADQKDYPNLTDHWGTIFNEILKDATDRENYKEARRLYHLFQTRFPGHAVANRWKSAYNHRAQKLFDESKTAFESGDFVLAIQKIETATAIEPDLSGLREHAQSLHAVYPSLTIGVSETIPAASIVRNSPENSFVLTNAHSPLAASRQQRLLYRNFVEQVGFEVEGGKYFSPYGTLSREDYGRTLRLQRDNSPVAAFDIAESLLRLSDPARNSSFALWMNLIESIEIAEHDRLAIRLYEQHVLPESMFRVPVFHSGYDRTVSRPTDGTGPYFRQDDAARPEWAIFHAAADSVLPVASGPKMIRELSVSETQEGLKLLAEKKILALDRLAPWEIAREPGLAEQFAEQYAVGRYATPTVLFLVPNRNRPLPASRTFRRALLYGLNRQAIVQQLSGTASTVELISGVAPKGTSDVDPIGYGYDPMIAPRLYDPKLAVALCLMSISHARDKNLLQEDEEPRRKRAIQLASDMPEIVLAHPNNTASQATAQMIWRQWESIGIPVRLVPYSADEPIGRGNRVDFWFVACPIFEPMFDVRAILSADGLVGASSVYMDLALKKLEQAKEWPDIARELRAIHRLTFEETSVLPLWQQKDCFLIHKELLGVLGRESLPESRSVPFNELLHFYQNVEHWRVPFVW